MRIRTEPNGEMGRDIVDSTPRQQFDDLRIRTQRGTTPQQLLGLTGQVEAAFVVKERMCKAKHLQLVSGTKAHLYWLGQYLWDLLLYSIICASTMLLFYAYKEPAFVGNSEQAAATALVLFLYGASVTPPLTPPPVPHMMRT